MLAAPLEGLAPGTLTDPVALRRKLAEMRRLGFATAPGSVESVSTGIAVAVRDHGTVVAALGVVLPRHEVDEQRTVVVLRSAAREIEETLTRSRAPFG